MKTEEIALSRVSENAANPREISQANFQKLVQSILTFPKMLQMRPIVCNENRVILGGNMRFRALLNIEQIEDEAIRNAIETVAVKLTDGEKQQLCSYWEKWKAEPKVKVVIADSLSEEETDEFIIKDNVYFGSWDEEKLKGAFDVDDMQRWGLNHWEIQQEATTYEPAEDEEQRIIIVYRSEDAQAVADMLGLDAIEKRNFDVEELKEKPE
ncbi:MAG: ParB N-terminal domain-containing protein [Segatella copri]|nr:ParB N-terminal domain-containing protein [Segatella copri]